MTTELWTLPVTNIRSTISLASAWNTWQNNQTSGQNTNKGNILIYIQHNSSPPVSQTLTCARLYTDIYCQISRILNILCIVHPTKPEPTYLCLSNSFSLPFWRFCNICNLVLSHCPLFLINFASLLWRNCAFKFKYVLYDERKLGVTTTGERNLLFSM